MRDGRDTNPAAATSLGAYGGMQSYASAGAAQIDRMLRERAELIQALKDLLPPMPPKDAICHNGICEQDRCARCQRIASAHAVLAKVQA